MVEPEMPCQERMISWFSQEILHFNDHFPGVMFEFRYQKKTPLKLIKATQVVLKLEQPHPYHLRSVGLGKLSQATQTNTKLSSSCVIARYGLVIS